MMTLTQFKKVSILIVMDVLLEGAKFGVTNPFVGFNPYCNGCTSRRLMIVLCLEK